MGFSDGLLRETIINCIKFGDFTLSSGAKSDFYFDLESIFCSYFNLETIREAMMRQIEQKVKDSITYILAGPALGAVPLMVSLGAHYYQFNKYLTVKNDGTIRHASSKSKLPVVLVDDVFQSGASLRKTIDACRKVECVSEFVGAYVVVNREPEKSKHFEVPVQSLFLADELVAEARRRRK